VALFKFLVAAGELTAGGVLAPVLAPHGLDLPRLVREVNERAVRTYARSTPLRLVVRVGPGRTFTFTLADPPAARLLQGLIGPDGALPRRRLYALALRSADPRRRAAELLAALGSFQRPVHLVP
jgi:hypothetical protein